ncbi:MAG TPA: hypothetical protein VMI52_07315 [Acetobacteraceae bacterium]|nr:hypothetical protein [Acetobacteraceae bacterium]
MVIILANRNWPKGVSVDVTVGGAPYVSRKRLEFNQTIRIAWNHHAIAYRRDLEPDRPDGRMTTWISLPMVDEEHLVAV